MTEGTAPQIRADGPGAWVIPSLSGRDEVYRVTLSSCTCKAFQYRPGPCKHIMAVVAMYEQQELADEPPVALEEPPADNEGEDDDDDESEPDTEEMTMGPTAARLCEVYSANLVTIDSVG